MELQGLQFKNGVVIIITLDHLRQRIIKQLGLFSDLSAHPAW